MPRPKPEDLPLLPNIPPEMPAAATRRLRARHGNLINRIIAVDDGPAATEVLLETINLTVNAPRRLDELPLAELNDMIWRVADEFNVGNVDDFYEHAVGLVYDSPIVKSADILARDIISAERKAGIRVEQVAEKLAPTSAASRARGRAALRKIAEDEDLRKIARTKHEVDELRLKAGSIEGDNPLIDDPLALSAEQDAIVRQADGVVIPDVTNDGVPLTPEMKDTIRKIMRLDEFQKEALYGLHLRSPEELIDSAFAAQAHVILGEKRPRVIKDAQGNPDKKANRAARAAVTKRALDKLNLTRDDLITTGQIDELGGLEAVEAAGGVIAGPISLRIRQLQAAGVDIKKGVKSAPTGVAIEKPVGLWVVGAHMSGVHKAEIENRRLFEGLRGLLQGGDDDAVERRLMEKELAKRGNEALDAMEGKTVEEVREALGKRIAPPEGSDVEAGGLAGAIDDLAGGEKVDLRKLPKVLGVHEERNPKIGGGVSGGGKFVKESGHPLEGLLFDDPDNRVTNAQILMTYKGVETAHDLSAMRIVNEITENYGHRLVVDNNALERGAKDAVDIYKPDGTLLKAFGTIEDAKAYIEGGIDFGGGKLPMAVWAPTDFNASRMVTRTVMNDTLSGMMEGKNLFEALTLSLRKNSKEFVDNIARAHSAGTGGIVPDATLGKGVGELWLIPQQVGKTLQDASNRGRPVTGMVGSSIGYYDDVIKFYKHIWLRSPRFVVNNNATNVMMAVMSGTHPDSLLQAFKKEIGDLLPEGVQGGEVRTFLEEVRQGLPPTNATMNNVKQFMRQRMVLSGLHELGAVIWDKTVGAPARRMDQFNQLTEDFWRRAAFIDRTRSLSKALKGADDGHLERLAKELSTQAGSMTSDAVFDKLVKMRENLLDGHLNDAMIANIGVVSSSAELTFDALKHVNKWYFDYGQMLPVEKEVMRRIFPFWQWQKNIHKLALRMPKDHPGRTMIAAHMAQVANEVTDQEELPPWLKSSVLFTAAKGPVGRRLGIEDTRLRAGGANPLMGLADPEGFHPILGFMASYVTGAKTFPTGGRFHDPEVIESFNRKFRIDPKTGRVTDEVDVVRPKVSQEFLKAIPQVRMAAEVFRLVVGEMPDGAVSDYLEGIVGETPKKRVGQFGVFDPKSPLTASLQWAGISTAPAPPTLWRQRIEALKRSAERKYKQLQLERQERGLLGEIGGV